MNGRRGSSAMGRYSSYRNSLLMPLSPAAVRPK
jgi:hypothetical protein